MCNFLCWLRLFCGTLFYRIDDEGPECVHWPRLHGSRRRVSQALQLAEKEWSADQVVEVLGDLGRTYDEEGKLEQAESAFKRRIAMADSEHLGAEMRIETRLAIAIFYSKHERCDELKSTLDSLNNSSDPEIRSSKGYQETIGLIADMSTLRCSGRN